MTWLKNRGSFRYRIFQLRLAETGPAACKEDVAGAAENFTQKVDHIALARRSALEKEDVAVKATEVCRSSQMDLAVFSQR